MSIDRIGKGKGVTGTDALQSTQKIGGKEVFEVQNTQATGSLNPAERVRAGELSMNDYIDLRVNEATQHLEGKLGPNDLSSIRGMLREQMLVDPAIQDMIKAATGSFPASSDVELG
jgi:hypothetical protein